MIAGAVHVALECWCLALLAVLAGCVVLWFVSPWLPPVPPADVQRVHSLAADLVSSSSSPSTEGEKK